MNNRPLQEGELYEERFGFRERNSTFRFLVVFLALVFALLGFRIFWASTFGGVVVDGGSMNQTLSNGDELLMRYVSEKRFPKRGDVIVIYVGDYAECKDVSSGFLIKRLIATAGDSLYCIDGQIYIRYDGEKDYVPLYEPYAYYGANDNYKDEYDFASYQDPYVVGEDEVFFLGDNRSWSGSSIDSRYRQYPHGSHLQDRLYKKADVYGVVPDWAIKRQKTLSKIFF